MEIKKNYINLNQYNEIIYEKLHKHLKIKKFINYKLINENKKTTVHDLLIK